MRGDLIYVNYMIVLGPYPKSMKPFSNIHCAVPILGSALATTLLYASPARAEEAVTAYADIRYRLELVDQDRLPKNATASTLRVRAGLKTSEWKGLSALVEGEAIVAVGAERFNDTINSRTQFPVVADPEAVLLNQIYLRWKPNSRIDLAGGRQAVGFDNQRWVGTVGWRQNDQTLDAAHVTVRPIKTASAEYLYAWRVNRVFGPDSSQGIWRDTGIHAARAGATIKSFGTLSVYGYWLYIPTAPQLSSRTLGLRLAGEHLLGSKVKLLYAAEYARQGDHGNNPMSFGHDYWLIEPGIVSGALTVKVGYERLEGDGVSALQTPLATLHAFNGWADKFLTTPPNGLRDTYVDAGYKFPALGPIKGAAFRIAYHDFHATRLGSNYGNEWGAIATLPVRKNISLLAKLARYHAKTFATDTTKAWFSIEAKF